MTCNLWRCPKCKHYKFECDCTEAYNLRPGGWLTIAATVLLLGLTGCGPGGLFLPNIKDYTPEQLEAYKELGYDAVRCANVKGPPPSGNVSTVTIPKGRNAKVLFNGCDVHSIEILGEIKSP